MNNNDALLREDIAVSFEFGFMVDKVSGIHLNSGHGMWVDVTGKYDPTRETLKVDGIISRDDGYNWDDYKPTAEELQLIKNLITERILQEYNQTPQEIYEAEG